MKHNYYALQHTDGAWDAYAQDTWESGEDDHDDGLSWMDCTKQRYSTEADAIAAILDIIAGHPDVAEFVAADETVIRYAIEGVACGDTDGTDDDKFEAGMSALYAEMQRAMNARAAT